MMKIFNKQILGGITFNTETNELQIQNNAECFLYSNVVVFRLKGDAESVVNTIAITKDSDIASQVNTIITEMNQLSESYHTVVQELDALNGSITSKVENMETKYNDDLREINTQLSTVIQTSTNIETQFQTLKEIVVGDEENPENGLKEKVEALTTYIRESGDGIEVGIKNDNVKTLMATNRFAIIFDKKEVMTLEKNLLTIDRILSRLSFELGSSIFTVKDYGFDITWGGE